MINEGLTISQAYRSGETWACARDRLLAQGASSLPKLASQTRALREVYDRIGHLSDAERHYLLVEADRAEQQAMMWLAVCRTYRFIQEFAVEVISERYQSWRLDLGHDVFDRFLSDKADYDPSLAVLSSSTAAKLRQVLFRILREAGLRSAEGRIQPIWLSGRMKRLIEESNPTDLRIFPGNGG
ncbi:BrxA family protein [Asaia lannensis]|uniref:BrxA family protein n=1 Tax=Asaia lannensis TaxID=415421 RepID=UPI003873561A